MSYVMIGLTFDGGPDGIPASNSGPKRYNTTKWVLDVLAATKPDPIVAAFFVQTHVPDRMATAHGQALVRRMLEEGHVVGILNGSDQSMELHTKQLAPSGLRLNLQQGVNALRALSGKPRVRYVRSPLGAHDDVCDTVYREIDDGNDPDEPDAPAGLTHIFWDASATFAPPGDLGPGVPVAEQERRLEKAVRDVADVARRRGPRTMVVRLHDVAATTVAYLPNLLRAMVRGGTRPGKKRVDVFFCRDVSELRVCLAQAPRGTTSSLLGRPAQISYAKAPRMIETDPDEFLTLFTWSLITSEGWINHLYLDSRNLITAGAGSFIEEPEELRAIEFRRTDDDAEATFEEKAAAWQTLKDAATKLTKKMARMNYADALALTKLRLTERAARTLLLKEERHHLELLDGVLAKQEIGKRADLPLPAQLALADMEYNLGPGNSKETKGLIAYKKMFTAIKAALKSRNWAGVAAECKRNPDSGGLAVRNAATRDLFNALTVLEGDGPRAPTLPARPAEVVEPLPPLP